MSEIELINWFKGQNKPYQGLIPQGSYSTYITRYGAGMLKPKTLIKFFERMGYVKNNGVWVKR